MRFTSKFLLFITLFLCACSPLEEKYVSEGIGTQLNRGQLAQVTQDLNDYFGYICEQAGVPIQAGEETKTPRCNHSRMQKLQWQAVVYQGLNDIDRRCDAYLGWLDNKRRSKGPVQDQLTDTSAATQAFMRFAGVGANPITAVGLAFGLLSDSVSNYNSRLLLEVDSSTVNTLVLTRQKEFREKIAISGIANRPQASYVIRSYLRLCLPFTIEADINNFTTFAAKKISAGKDGQSVVGVAAGLPRRFTAIDPVKRDPPLPPTSRIVGAKGTYEQEVLSKKDLKKIQALFCLNVDGKIGPATRDGIRIAEWQFGANTIDGIINIKEGEAYLGLFEKNKKCSYPHKNVIERYTFSVKKVENIKRFQRLLNQYVGGDEIPVDGAWSDALRQKIIAANSTNSLSGNANLTNQITVNLLVAIGYTVK